MRFGFLIIFLDLPFSPKGPKMKEILFLSPLSVLWISKTKETQGG